ncbi:hypothetical protein M011DRAFT_446330 [Sporormia fimetaria CBS 119925]|uniref:G domain-containing protein n=1 Tax=Sporormia fimetaria CBS 119925 TaxID=1340428 RepID=A0A6A6V6V4_9PLEO|nr:hypothetical protein M011DRAFT_446330 [Sporormia fimetaria CBS 119925]
MGLGPSKEQPELKASDSTTSLSQPSWDSKLDAKVSALSNTMGATSKSPSGRKETSGRSASASFDVMRYLDKGSGQRPKDGKAAAPSASEPRKPSKFSYMVSEDAFSGAFPTREASPPASRSRPSRIADAPAMNSSRTIPDIAQERGAKPPDIKPDDIVIAVMGVTGSGKTTFVSHFADRHVEIGHGLESCTQDVDAVACTFNERPIWLIDTPGFDDTYRTDSDILREVAQWLNTAYKKNIQLTGIIYLHRISDTRVGNAAFKNLRMFKKLCGNDGLASVVLATTMWSGINAAAEADREAELLKTPTFWKEMIERGSKVFRHDRGRKTASDIVSYLIQKRRPVTLDIQKEMVDQKKKLVDTGAGAEVATEVERKATKWSSELSDIKKEIQEAIDARDTKYRAELEAAKEDLTRKIAREQEAARKLQADSEQLHEQMKREYEEKYRKMMDMLAEKDRLLEEARGERERVKERNEHEIELKRLEMQMRLKEQYYRMVYATRCVVM